MDGGFGFRRFDEDALGRFPQSVVAGRTVTFDFKLPVDGSTVHVTADRQINFSLNVLESDFRISLPVSGGAANGPIVAVIADAVIAVSTHFLTI